MHEGHEKWVQVLVRLREWKSPLGALAEDNIKINIKETGCEDLDGIGTTRC
jgi:hypothetical protein